MRTYLGADLACARRESPGLFDGVAQSCRRHPVEVDVHSHPEFGEHRRVAELVDRLR